MCQHAASIVDTAVQKLSVFLSKALNNTLGDSKLLFPYSPLQFFPLALPHQSQMLKPLFLCQLCAQIIQFKCLSFFVWWEICSLSKRWRNRGTEILPRNYRQNEPREQEACPGGSFPLFQMSCWGEQRKATQLTRVLPGGHSLIHSPI